jgi:hypothetical protein
VENMNESEASVSGGEGEYLREDGNRHATNLDDKISKSVRFLIAFALFAGF